MKNIPILLTCLLSFGIALSFSIHAADMDISKETTRMSFDEQEELNEELHQAASRGDKKRVEEIIHIFHKHGTEGTVCNITGALLGAGTHGHQELIPLLLAYASPSGKTFALMHFTGKPNANATIQATIQVLLANGVSAHSQNTKNGETALIAACRQGNIEVARLLLEAGAVINTHNAKGETALSIAQANGTNQPLIDLLQEYAQREVDEDIMVKPAV